MKNALIIHGTDFDKTRHQRENNWFPWLKKELEKKDYGVFLQEMPLAWKPDIDRYWNFLKDRFKFNKESVLIGHSSGAVAILGLLDRLPKSKKVDKAILVGSYLNEEDDGATIGLFKKPFDWEKIKNSANEFHIIHSDDDPHCPLEDAEEIAENLGTEVTLMKGQKHFSISTVGDKYKKFPELLEIIESSNEKKSKNKK